MADDIRLDDAEAVLTRAEIAAIQWRERWYRQAWAREKGPGKQIPPAGNWTQLVFRAGRGFGKTRAETEWLAGELVRVPGTVGHAVAPTLSDARGTVFLGHAGFKPVIPAECLRGESWEIAYDSTHLELHLKNGSMIRGFGAKDAGARLRGPQCHAAIGDELREWDSPKGNLGNVHSNMMFGLRLPYPDGTLSRAVMGTTPKPIEYLKNLYKAPRVKVVTGSSYENVPNLSDSFRDRLFSLEGTKVGRVEIHAEDIDAEEDAILQRGWIRLWPANKELPEFIRIIMSMDTAFEDDNYHLDKKSGDADPDYSACGTFGVFNTKSCFTEEELKKLGVKSKYAVLLIDFWMEKLDFPDLLEKARETYRTRWGSTRHRQLARRPDLVLIENKQSGISLRQVLARYGVPVWPYNPHGQSKTMRVHAASPLIMQGMLFMPESKLPDRKGMVRNWCDPLLEQLCTFVFEGSIKHDDGVDATVQLMLYLMEQGTLLAEPQGRAYPDADEAEEKRLRDAERQANRDKARRESAYGA